MSKQINDWFQKYNTKEKDINEKFQPHQSIIHSGRYPIQVACLERNKHIDIEKRDKELEGCRILEAQKNRFGGTGNHVYLDLHRNGFTEIARITS